MAKRTDHERLAWLAQQNWIDQGLPAKPTRTDVRWEGPWVVVTWRDLIDERMEVER